MAMKVLETQGIISRTVPPDYATATATRPQDGARALENATAWIPNLPTTQTARYPRLEKPVVIPRLDVSGRLGIPLPFMRAYSPALRSHDVNEGEFVAFIDDLAVAQAAPPPLQALDVAGRAVGFVPHHWAMFAGAGMNVAAGVGTAAVSYGRTRYFLEKVNREYFAPRGLRVSVCKYQQLVEKLGLDTAAVVLPGVQAGVINIRDRCMTALQPYIASLTLNVPPPSGERNVLDRLAAKGIERKRQKQDKNHRKRADDDGYSSDSSSSSSSSSESESDNDKAQRKMARRVRKINRKAKKDLRKHPANAVEIEEDRAKRVHQIENKPLLIADKGNKKRNKKLSKDLEKLKRLEFIVVEDLAEQRGTS